MPSDLLKMAATRVRESGEVQRSIDGPSKVRTEQKHKEKLKRTWAEGLSTKTKRTEDNKGNGLQPLLNEDRGESVLSAVMSA